MDSQHLMLYELLEVTILQNYKDPAGLDRRAKQSATRIKEKDANKERCRDLAMQGLRRLFFSPPAIDLHTAGLP